jgi:hypothetical protein
MQSDGEQNWNYPGRRGVERVWHANYLSAFVEIGNLSDSSHLQRFYVVTIVGDGRFGCVD